MSFKNTIVVMTSNLGSGDILDTLTALDADLLRERVMQQVGKERTATEAMHGGIAGTSCICGAGVSSTEIIMRCTGCWNTCPMLLCCSMAIALCAVSVKYARMSRKIWALSSPGQCLVPDLRYHVL